MWPSRGNRGGVCECDLMTLKHCYLLQWLHRKLWRSRALNQLKLKQMAPQRPLLNLFSSGQTDVRLSGAEAANRAQCAAPDKPVGYWNLLVVFANLKRVIQCACFKSPGSRKGTPKCNLRILAVAQHLPRKWRLVSSSSLQRGQNHISSNNVITQNIQSVIILSATSSRSLIKFRWKLHLFVAGCSLPPSPMPYEAMTSQQSRFRRPWP